jgi:transposase InsO family protein
MFSSYSLTIAVESSTSTSLPIPLRSGLRSNRGSIPLRDRDKIYGDAFQKRVENMGFEEVLIAPRSPWQNPYAERLSGSIRREVLDHVIVLNERHLRCVLTSYLGYYHRSRTHLSLE